MPARLFGERERRFAVTRGEAEAIVAEVGRRLPLDRHHHHLPVAYTRTTYLDTGDLVYLRSCNDPDASSRRMRIREYAAAPNLVSPPVMTGHYFLERKESSGATRAKQRFAAPTRVIWQMVRDGGRFAPLWSDRLRSCAAFLAIREELQSQRLAPKLTTWYRRWSFRGAEVRVTLDEAVAYCRPLSPRDGPYTVEPKQVVGYAPTRILEVKHPSGDPPSWVEEIVAGLTRCSLSKFQFGMRVMRSADVSSWSLRQTPPVPIQLSAVTR